MKKGQHISRREFVGAGVAATGVAAVCAAFFMVTAALSRQTYVSALAAALLGAALGFLFRSQRLTVERATHDEEMFI